MPPVGELTSRSPTGAAVPPAAVGRQSAADLPFGIDRRTDRAAGRTGPVDRLPPLTWLAFLVVGGLVIIGYELVPAGIGADAMYSAVGLGGVSAILVGIRVHRPTMAGPWYLMAAGQLLWAIGDIVDSWLTDISKVDEFPSPVPGQGSTAFRYRLNDDGDTPTLYMNSLLPGKSTIPHNHETWAIISAVEGQEINYVYGRSDDGCEPGFTTLTLEKEVIVQPGTSISFLGEDLHGIRVEGETPTLHFHLYGLPLESLNGRYGVEADGRILNYNASQMAPSIKAYA